MSNALTVNRLFTLQDVPLVGVASIDSITGKDRAPGDPGAGVCKWCKNTTVDCIGEVKTAYVRHKKRLGHCPFESGSSFVRAKAYMSLNLFDQDQRDITVDDHLFDGWTDRIAFVVSDSRRDNTASTLREMELVAHKHGRLMVLVEYAPKSSFTLARGRTSGKIYDWENARPRLAFVASYTLIATSDGVYRYYGAVGGKATLARAEKGIDLVRRVTWFDNCNKDKFENAFQGFSNRIKERHYRDAPLARECRLGEGRINAKRLAAKVAAWDSDDNDCEKWLWSEFQST